jgi:hypothetical protein
MGGGANAAQTALAKAAATHAAAWPGRDAANSAQGFLAGDADRLQGELDQIKTRVRSNALSCVIGAGVACFREQPEVGDEAVVALDRVLAPPGLALLQNRQDVLATRLEDPQVAFANLDLAIFLRSVVGASMRGLTSTRSIRPAAVMPAAASRPRRASVAAVLDFSAAAVSAAIASARRRLAACSASIRRRNAGCARSGFSIQTAAEVQALASHSPISVSAIRASRAARRSAAHRFLAGGPVSSGWESPAAPCAAGAAGGVADAARFNDS